MAQLDLELNSGGSDKAPSIWPHCLFKCWAKAPPRQWFHKNIGHANHIQITVHFVPGKKISNIIDVVELDILFIG